MFCISATPLPRINRLKLPDLPAIIQVLERKSVSHLNSFYVTF